MKESKLKFDIQLFAEGDDTTQQDDGAPTDENTGDAKQTDKGSPEEQNQDKKQDDVISLTTQEFQSKVDSAVRQALKTREENLKKQQTEEKLKSEKKFEELLNLKEQELEAARKEMEQTRVNQKIVSMLAEKKLNPEYNKFVQAQTDEEAELQIINLERLIQAERKAALDAAQGGGTVLPGGRKAGGSQPESLGKRLAGMATKTNEEAVNQFFK